MSIEKKDLRDGVSNCSIYQNEPLHAVFSDFRSQRDQSVRTHMWPVLCTPYLNPFVFLFLWKWFRLALQSPAYTNKCAKVRWTILRPSSTATDKTIFFDRDSFLKHQINKLAWKPPKIICRLHNLINKLLHKDNKQNNVLTSNLWTKGMIPTLVFFDNLNSSIWTICIFWNIKVCLFKFHQHQRLLVIPWN